MGRQKPPEPVAKPPEPVAYTRPKGFPACCDKLLRLYDSLSTNHMVLLDVDVDEERMLLPGNGLVHWTFGDALLQDLPAFFPAMIGRLVETAQILLPAGREMEMEAVEEMKKIKVPEKDKSYPSRRVGKVDIIHAHLLWAKRILGTAPRTVYVAPAMPVLLTVDGELRGFILGSCSVPPGLEHMYGVFRDGH